MFHFTRALVTVLVTVTAGVALASDVNFESPPVDPVEISPSGDYLCVAHMADHRLVVYLLTGPNPQLIAEIMVGIEPVTVRFRTNTEVWVINHISDSISIVDLLTRSVMRTLLVGDEPTDVQFANGKAFVCVSQEDLIRVYDLSDLDAPPADIALEMSDPRSLALSNDGATLYVAAMDSQNKTTVIPPETVAANGGLPAPMPAMDPLLPPAPEVGLIVRHNGSDWVDDTGGSWGAVVPYTMPDNDVFAISTTTLAVTNTYHDVGTSLFNIAVHPTTNDLYVTNQEAFNEIRFEPNLQGKFVHNRITRIEPTGGIVTPHHINSHIDYGVPAGNASERAMSLAIPLDLEISSSGTEIYVAAFGSRKVGVLDASGNVVRRITVGEGPGGLALDELRNRLYVYNRFASSLSVVDLSDDSSVEMSLGYDPSPPTILDGRKFLYDGEISSAHGDLACASCHLFGGMDNIAWDLGNPVGDMIPVPPGQIALLPDFHPMKGPMVTQSLKGIQDTEPLHWRGDRANFGEFSPAFIGLMGRATELAPGDFQSFEDFVFTIQYPSNPFLSIDGSYPPSINGADPAHGEQLFLTGRLLNNTECVDCHALPSGENGTIILGSLLMEPEAKVVPQLRNMYEKTRFDRDAPSTLRGFGYTADGAIKDLFTFLEFPAFRFDSDGDQRDVEAFLLAFPTETHPAVGAQLTMDGMNEAQWIGRLNTLQGEAELASVGLVAKGAVGGQARGWVYIGSNMYTPDKEGEPDIDQASLLALAGPGSEITFTAVVEGCQWRLGVDRDLDSYRDGDELDAGSDPGDPDSTPDSPPTAINDVVVAPPALWLLGPNPARFQSRLGFRVGEPGATSLEVYDVRGRLVRRLLSGENRPPGTYYQEWNLHADSGNRVSSGIYFVRLRTVGVSMTRRIVVVR